MWRSVLDGRVVAREILRRDVVDVRVVLEEALDSGFGVAPLPERPAVNRR